MKLLLASPVGFGLVALIASAQVSPVLAAGAPIAAVAAAAVAAVALSSIHAVAALPASNPTILANINQGLAHGPAINYTYNGEKTTRSSKGEMTTEPSLFRRAPDSDDPEDEEDSKKKKDDNAKDDSGKKSQQEITPAPTTSPASETTPVIKASRPAQQVEFEEEEEIEEEEDDDLPFSGTILSETKIEIAGSGPVSTNEQPPNGNGTDTTTGEGNTDITEIPNGPDSDKSGQGGISGESQVPPSTGGMIGSITDNISSNAVVFTIVGAVVCIIAATAMFLMIRRKNNMNIGGFMPNVFGKFDKGKPQNTRANVPSIVLSPPSFAVTSEAPAMGTVGSESMPRPVSGTSSNGRENAMGAIADQGLLPSAREHSKGGLLPLGFDPSAPGLEEDVRDSIPGYISSASNRISLQSASSTVTSDHGSSASSHRLSNASSRLGRGSRVEPSLHAQATNRRVLIGKLGLSQSRSNASQTARDSIASSAVSYSTQATAESLSRYL